MVSRVNTTRTDRRFLPRDEHVSRAAQTVRKHRRTGAYEYSFKWKSGSGRTHDANRVAVNRIHLFGKMIEEEAQENRDFYLWNIRRVLKYQAKVRDY